jgi:hypothetical protein
MFQCSRCKCLSEIDEHGIILNEGVHMSEVRRKPGKEFAWSIPGTCDEEIARWILES